MGSLYNGTGVNITNPQSIAIPASYEYTAELAAYGLDFATASSWPSFIVSVSFVAYNQYAEYYDSSLS